MRFTAALSLCVQIFLYRGCVSDGATVIVEPKSVAAPVNSTVSFNCTIADTKEDVRWYITLPNAAIKLWPQEANAPALQGVVRNASNTIKYNGTLNGTAVTVSQSTLYVAAVQKTNGTTVKCGVLSNLDSTSKMSSLIVFDRPPPPANVRVRVLGELQLEISWSPAVPIPGVDTWYGVHVRDLTEATDVLDALVGTGNSSYVYRHSMVRGPLCHLYQFTVVAGNAAGESAPGGSLLATNIPANPVLSNATSVVYLSHNVSVLILIKSTVGCPNFTIQGYQVHLEDLVSTQVLDPLDQLPPDGKDAGEIEINVTAGLHINTKYAVTVRGFNSVGNSSNISLLVYTTDVQSSTITGSDHQLNVTCFFAEGTLAKGCVVCLKKSAEVVHVYQMIPRVNGTAKGVIRTEFSVDCYNISVMDWEEDGSIGSLRVPVNSNLYTANDQGNPGKGLVEGSSILISFMTGALVAIAMVLCATIFITLIVVMLRRGRNTFGVDHASIDAKQTATCQQPALYSKSSEAENRIYDTVTVDSSDYSTLNTHSEIEKKCAAPSDLEYSQLNQQPSYATLEVCHPTCLASNGTTHLYSEISPPHQSDLPCYFPVLTRMDDPQPYLCVSQVSDSQMQSNCSVVNSVTDI